MKVLDLFSGIGGFSLGLEWAGMSTVAFCERDPYCTTILNKHWPDTPVHSDVRNLDGKEYAESIDVVCGGFPCQPFSTAGLKRGSEDDRHLWPEMLRIIRESKPRWVIGENVSGFINMALDDVSLDLESEGYEVRPFVLPACAVDARHRRDRVFIIAYRDPALVNASSEHGRRDTDRRGGAGMEMGGDVLAQTRRHQVSDATDRPSAHVAHADEHRLEEHGHSEPAEFSKASQRPKHVADTHGEGELQQEGLEHEVGRWSGDGGKESESMAYATDAGLQRRSIGGDIASEGQTAIEQSSRFGDLRRGREWPVEPPLPRMAHGVPNRVDRVKALGNAVVPQLIQTIGELVLAADKEIYDVKS